MTDTAVRADQASREHPAHPLDPATAAEYLAGRDIMAAAGLLAEPVRFAYYGLEEPPKDEVLANTTADRRLRAFLVNTGTGESTDVVVSLTHQQIVSARRLDPAKTATAHDRRTGQRPPSTAAKRSRTVAAVWSGGASQTSALKISTST